MGRIELCPKPETILHTLYSYFRIFFIFSGKEKGDYTLDAKKFNLLLQIEPKESANDFSFL